MSSKNSRLALAAAALALSLPALAADPVASSISGDPTWPAIENPAPALAVNATGSVEALRADPLFPATDSAAPAIALVAVPDDGRPLYEPAESWDTPSYAIAAPSAQASEHLAAASR